MTKIRQRLKTGDNKNKSDANVSDVSDTANKLATSRCNGIWETTRHNRHDGLLPEQTCLHILPTCYGKLV